MRKITIGFCLLVTIPAITFARGWRGIIPLHSTCADVKRLLGVTTCDGSTHPLNDETVTIVFSEKPCLDGWNVPPGTVMTIDVHPKPGLKLIDLQIDERNYNRVADEHVRGIVYYSNNQEGVSITVFPDGTVGSFLYGPAAEDNYLRYPKWLAEQPTTSGDAHSIRKFDEYGKLASAEERKRLDYFAIQLQSEPSAQGYIIAYAGRRAHTGEAQARVEQAKAYLVNKRRLESGRIVTLDGGYREASTVELFISAKGGAAPIPSPTVCPSEVRIIEATSARNARRPTRPPNK